MKKLLIFLMVAIPLVIIVILNLTVKSVVGYVSVPVESIALDQSSVTGIVGDIYTLNAQIYPTNASNQKIKWESDNEEVATVDENGNVSFVDYGKCYISAVTEDGNKKASCYFYIYDTVCHDITLFSESEYIEIGKSMQVTASIMPVETINKEVEYKSYDEDIATIDSNGYVTAHKPGYVTISATAAGTNITAFLSLLSYKAVETIEVEQESVLTSSLDYQIKTKTYPLDATQTKLNYTSSDTEIATVNSRGYVSFLKAGSVDITISTFDERVVKTVKVSSTGGFADQIIVKEQVINVTLADAPKYLDVEVVPSQIGIENLEIISENPDICYVDEANYIQYVSTGSAIIRIKSPKPNGEYLEQTILVNISHPAEGIDLEDVYYCSQNTFKLNPKSYPEVSTNQDFFYHIEGEDAVVSADGLVTKKADGVSEVEVTVYANHDLSDIYKVTKVIFTNNLPSQIKWTDDQFEINVGETFVPAVEILPINTTGTSFNYEILEQSPNAGETSVEIKDGNIVGVRGGEAKIKVIATLYDGSKQEQVVLLIVKSYAKEILFDIDLDFVNGEYVTGQPTINFQTKLLPEDVSENFIEWRVEKGSAIISGNSLKFNSRGQVVIVGVSQDGKVSKKISLNYVGQSPLSATFTPLPEKIYVGDTFTVDVLEIYPKNAMLNDLSYEVIDQVTASATSSKVLDIVDGKLKAVAGGTCTLIVNLSSSYRKTFEIEVIRLPEAIIVSPSNIQTTNTEIVFSSTILPYDTTNKQVEYVVDNEEIATVEGNVLRFKQIGLVEITAKCVADNNVTYIFTVEKVDKPTASINPTNTAISLQVGDKSTLELDNFCSSYSSYTIEVVEGKDFIQISSDNIITAINTGNSEIEIYFYDINGVVISFFKVKVAVVQLVSDFEVFEDLDVVNGERQTAIPEVLLTATTYPETATNKQLKYIITDSFTSSGASTNNIAYVDGNKLIFMQSGLILLRVSTTDGGDVEKSYRVRYTGGNATSFELSVESNINLNIGESVEIKVLKWIPQNTTNTQMFIEKVYQSPQGADVISIKNQTITAIGGGTCGIRVEVSNGLTKYITINVFKGVEDIVVENDNVLTGKTEYTIAANAIPADASNKTLAFSIVDGECATVEGNVVKFTSAGTVKVKVSSTDGTEISKIIEITSTFGEISEFELVHNNFSIIKGGQATVEIASYLPNDIAFDNSKVFLKIAENMPEQEGLNVVSINSNKIIAQNGGRASILVEYKNGDTVVSRVVDVTVMQMLQDITIVHSREIDNVYGTNIIGTKQLGFDLSVEPMGTLLKSINATSSDTSIAKVDKNNINFLKEGRVDITYKAVDLLDNSVVKTISYYYTAGKLIEVEFETAGSDGSVINLNAGENFEFKIKSSLPRDVKIEQILMTDKTEKRNSTDLAVMSFENGKVLAEHGGEASFKLNICGFVSNSYKVVVNQNVSSIVSEAVVYTATAEAKIAYSVLPLDASNKEVDFEIDDESVATISSEGVVKFNGYGSVVVTIRSKNDPTIIKQIEVTYSNKVKALTFVNVPDSMFTRTSITINVAWEPYGADEFTLGYTVDKPELASFAGGGNKLFANDGANGRVFVEAYVVEDPTIRVGKYIEIKTLISNIQLELNQADDDQGIGGYRVFGDKWYTAGGALTRSYQMKIASISPAGSTAELLWFSSNQSIATVDSKGVVTFTGEAGDVTITVQPKDQINPNAPLKSSYTFHIVKGTNVINETEFIRLVDSVADDIVLQADLELHGVRAYNIRKNLHGNGHVVDLEMPHYQAAYNRVLVTQSNVVVDNAHFIGATLDPNGSLQQLDGKGSTLTVITPDTATEKVVGVVIKNCIIENGMKDAEVVGADATFVGCIIRNSCSGGLCIYGNNIAMEANVVVRDCIFTQNMLSSILFDVAERAQPLKQKSSVKCEGYVKLMNWIDIDNVGGSILSTNMGGFNLSEVKSDIQKQVKSYTQFTKSYKGREYFMAGIVAIKAGVDGVLTYTSELNANVDGLSSDYTYVPFNVSGASKVVGIPMTFNMVGYTLPSSSDAILPDDKITSLDYQKIKQAR